MYPVTRHLNRKFQSLYKPNILNDVSLTLWKGHLSIRKYLLLKASKFKINNLVWENGYTQVAGSSKRRDALLYI
jgi:hypothetical protein